MTTIDSLRVTLERNYLEPLTEQTPKAPLDGALDNSSQSVRIDTSVLSPDEESYIAAGVTVEVDYELMLVLGYDQSTKILTVDRGYEGTAPAAHSNREPLRVPSRWPRADQEQAIREAIDSLYPPLYTAVNAQATVGTMRFVQLPLTATKVLRIQWQDRDRWRDCQGELFSVHPLDPTFAAVQVESGVPSGRMCLVRYGVKPTVPDTVTDDIEDFTTKWSRLIVVDAAVRLMSGVDIDAVTQEYLTEQYRLDRFPVRSGGTITEQLIRYREYLLENAQEELVANDPVMIVMNEVEYYG